MQQHALLMGVIIALLEHTVVDGQNLALLRPTSQSSVRHGAVSSRAVDGNTDGDFSHQSCTHTDDSEPWLGVDLGATHDISSVVVYNRVDCCSDRLTPLTVVVSDEGFSSAIDYYTLDTYSFCASMSGSASYANTLSCAAGARGRYVYLYLPVSKPIALTVCELEVFGTLAAGNISDEGKRYKEAEEEEEESEEEETAHRVWDCRSCACGTHVDCIPFSVRRRSGVVVCMTRDCLNLRTSFSG